MEVKLLILILMAMRWQKCNGNLKMSICTVFNKLNLEAMAKRLFKGIARKTTKTIYIQFGI